MEVGKSKFVVPTWLRLMHLRNVWQAVGKPRVSSSTTVKMKRTHAGNTRTPRYVFQRKCTDNMPSTLAFPNPIQSELEGTGAVVGRLQSREGKPRAPCS